MKRSGIVCAGNFIVDYVALVNRYPAEDTLADIESSKATNGGPAYNALVDLAHLNVRIPLKALGCLGNDAEGRHILRHCRRLKIDTRNLRLLPKMQTSYSDIVTVKATGRRTIFHFRGANALLNKKHFDFRRTTAKVFHLGFLSLLNQLDAPSRTHGTVAAEVLAAAKKAGLTTSADVVSDTSGRLSGLVRAALPHLDYFFVNEIEVGLLTGLNSREMDGTLNRPRLTAACRELLQQGMNGWLVAHTAEGALALKTGEPDLWRGSVEMPVKTIAGTNGAGDAFAAGFLYGVHEEKPVAESLQIAACVAAASLTDSAPSDGIGTLAACLALGKRYGFRR